VGVDSSVGCEMSINSVFKTYVEPSLERIPVLEVSHTETHRDQDYVIVQTIHRNVLTDFDRKLSRHLSATRGAGFPAFTTSVTVTERGGDAAPRVLSPAHHVSVPHALKGIAERAFAHSGQAKLTIHHNDPSAQGKCTGTERVVTQDDIDSLKAALAICRYLGEAEFLTISGDFDIVIAQPPGDLEPIVMHLQNGSITMPCPSGGGTTPFECPIHNFAAHTAGNVLAQGYLARTRHALVATKETAVADFRSAAERRILDFDKALNGRPLQGHRLEATIALVERLKSGLGDGLKGLAEDAQITALDWSTEISTGDRKRITMVHPSRDADMKAAATA